MRKFAYTFSKKLGNKKVKIVEKHRNASDPEAAFESALQLAGKRKWTLVSVVEE